jgi:two-component system, chemotaxis family, sensor kinase CheA
VNDSDQVDHVDLREFIGGFVAEAEELVAAANAALLEIETANASGGSRPRAVHNLFRALHTIKGLAGMIGVEPIVEIAHALETLVRVADRGAGTLRRGAVEICLQALQAIGQGVRAVAEQRDQPSIPAALLDAIAATDVGSEAPMTPPPIAVDWDDRLSTGEREHLFQALRRGAHAHALVFRPSVDNAARDITIATVRARLSAIGEIVKVVPRAVTEPSRGVVFDILVLSEAAPAELAEAAAADVSELVAVALPEPAKPVTASAPELDVTPIGRSLVRVELARLDALQEQLSQLIVSRFRLDRAIAAQAAHGHDVRALREVAELQGRQLREMRRAILRARLVRVAEVLEPLSLLVRSLTRPGYKEVRLELDARDAEIDKAVADQLLPAIIHLVRNAVDHAIETVDDRRARGKPQAGALRITCCESSGNAIALELRDDGRGIDRAEIARRVSRPIDGDDNLLDVLTTPGFSTRDVATETSGRGLGLDIVRRIIVDQLGGELAVESELGAGTMFRMRVPVTIAIMDVFSFACGPQAFVVPVGAIDEILELDPERSIVPPAHAGALRVTLVERRGRAMPIVSLAELLAIGDGAAAHKALVIRRNGEPIAFAVDRMIGRQEVVVRPIEDPLAHAPGIAGATDLGDGRPTLLLDLGELGGRIAQRERRV